MARFGQWVGSAGENISYGQHEAREIVCSWIMDAGISSRGHRKNIFNPSFGAAGVACGPHAVFRTMCVMDFAADFVERGNSLAGQ